MHLTALAKVRVSYTVTAPSGRTITQLVARLALDGTRDAVVTITGDHLELLSRVDVLPIVKSASYRFTLRAVDSCGQSDETALPRVVTVD